MDNEELAEVLKSIGLQREKHYKAFDKSLLRSEKRIDKTAHMQEQMLEAFKDLCALTMTLMNEKEKLREEYQKDIKRVRDDYEKRLNQSIDFRNRLQDQNDKFADRQKWLEEENTRLWSKIVEKQSNNQPPTMVTVGDFKSAQK